MSRPDITPEMADALAGDGLILLPVVMLDILNDPVYAWGGVGTLEWDGKSWTGIGQLGEIGELTADAKGGVDALTLKLNDIDTEILTAAQTATYQGQRAKVWLACFDGGLKMIGNPALFFAGEISTISLMDGANRSVHVSIESRVALLRRQRPTYRTSEDQQRRYPDDRFFDFVPRLAEKTIYWGLKAAVPATPSTPRTPGGSNNGHRQ